MSNPYKVYLVSETITSSQYNFECDNGILYQIAFDKILLSSIEHEKSDSVYAISFVPLTTVEDKQEDIRIRITIAAAITAFIQLKSVAIVYICDSQDNRPQCRQRLFTGWSAKCLDLDLYNYEENKIEYDENNIVYGGIIWENADVEMNEYLSLVELEFNEK